MRNKIFCIIFFIILAAYTFWGCTRTSYLESGSAKEAASDDETSTDSKTGSGDSLAKDEMTSKIFVQVAGAVNTPGVYEFKPDSRIYEAIEAAGGLTEDASDAELNQAAVMEDGQKIYVYRIGERESLEGSTESSGAPDAASSGLVNINTASAEELTGLSGIGPSKADAIIAYRTDNGAFTKAEDLMNVDGIGEGTYSRIKDQITV